MNRTVTALRSLVTDIGVRRMSLVVLAFMLGSWLAGCSRQDDHTRTAPTREASSTIAESALNEQARATMALIRAGGPFPYRKDGSTFFNREGLLPDKPRGYYREYTVDTPGSPDRGARRIVTGGRPPVVFYYTADHYRSFRQIETKP